LIKTQSKRDLEKSERETPLRFLVFVLFSVLGIVVLSALGVWQVERRTWKLALIDRVDQRIHAAPVPAPGPDAWPAINRDDDEYRRV
jgi:surfeit locus 1 family protein